MSWHCWGGYEALTQSQMIFPGYLLNPGDMFSVDPESVLFATGARKKRKDTPGSTQTWLRDAKGRTASHDKDARAVSAKTEEDAILKSEDDSETLAIAPEAQTDAKKALKSLMLRARKILDESKTDLSGKRLRDLRDFTRSVRTTLSKHGSNLPEGDGLEKIADLEKALSEITIKIPPDDAPRDAATAIDVSAPASASAPAPTPASSNPQASKPDAYSAKKDAELLAAALERARENPVDPSKPYATPWRPREYMSAFAFIPRYLEVNHNICSAVYLRHPVARPGLAEVPSPFGGDIMSLAFNWYLRRR